MNATPFPDVKPFPGAASQAAAPIGHNRPPLDESVVADFEEGLRSTPGLMDRIAQLIERGNAAGPCDNDELAGRYADFAKMVRTAAAAVDAEREKHNRPLLNAQRALKARADAITSMLSDAGSRVRRHLDAYMAEQRRKADEERRRAEEQARAAREAAEAEARRQAEDAGLDAAEIPEPAINIPEPVVEAPVIRGEYGARAGTTTVWKHEIISVRKLPDAILKHEKVVETINKVIAAQVRSGARDIKGCRIWSEEELRIN